MKNLRRLIPVVAVALMTMTLVSCERDVVPLPTSIEHFTVSSSKRVKFAKGNLQHHPESGAWRIASSPFEYLADPLLETQGWVDLFPWTPEGWHYGEWRALSHEEWHYLLTFRTNAPKKRGLVSVEGVNGLAILPDGWKRPADVPFYADAEDYTTNAYTLDQWNLMEKGGAIFLPAAGEDRGSQLNGAGTDGFYWSTSPYNELCAWNVAFRSNGIGSIYGHNRTHGYSVRLVIDD